MPLHSDVLMETPAQNAVSGRVLMALAEEKLRREDGFVMTAAAALAQKDAVEALVICAGGEGHGAGRLPPPAPRSPPWRERSPHRPRGSLSWRP